MAHNRDSMKHAAWDGGAISENPFFLATVGQQKTIKTRCGKRVSMKHVDNDTPTCAECLADIERERVGLIEIEQYAQDVQTGGLEYANAQNVKLHMKENSL